MIAGAGAIKVACVGDSVTRGTFVWRRSKNSYPAQLQSMLGDRFRVSNFGVNGHAAQLSADRPYWNSDEFTSSGTFQPDIVLIMLGTNDVRRDNWKGADSFAADYRKLVVHYQSLESRPVVSLLAPPALFRTRRSTQVRYGMDEQALHEIRDVIEAVARELGCGFVDVHAATAGHPEAFRFDGVHPGAAGATYIARAVFGCAFGAPAMCNVSDSTVGGFMRMPSQESRGLLTRTEQAMSVALAALMAVQAALGVLFPGAYRDVEWIKATWFGNDLVTLCLAVPLLLLTMRLASGGSVRARLIWLGVLGYAVYNYTYYVLGAALNVFFALYTLTFVVSLASLIVGLLGTDAESVSTAFSDKTAVRTIGGYYIFVAVGLSVVWLGAWAAYAFAGRPTPVETEAFHLVAALDLMLMVPALVTGGVLLWRRRPWGYVISAVAGIQAALYLLVLSVNSAVAIGRGLAVAPGELPIWGPLLVLTFAATAWLVSACRTRGEPR